MKKIVAVLLYLLGVNISIANAQESKLKKEKSIREIKTRTKFFLIGISMFIKTLMIPHLILGY
jgi:hypothetical protein